MVDAIVQRAVAQASAPVPRKLGPLFRQLLFYIYYVPTLLALLPFNIIRSLFPFLRKDPRWSSLQNLSVVHVRRIIRMFVRFGYQPIQPREGGWRESNTHLGTFLAFVNMSGPGGKVVHPELSLEAARKATKDRQDRLWLPPPPLDAFKGILSIRTGKPGQGFAHSKVYQGPPLVDPGFAKVRTRAFWFMHRPGVSPPHPSDSGNQKIRKKPIILYFHGGAGVTFSAGDLFMGETLAANLAKTTGMDVFSVDYLLAPEAKFPGSIVQALAAWLYLTRECGFLPSQIIVGGDSYGGELTLSFIRFLMTDFTLSPVSTAFDSEAAMAYEKPSALLLLSPYCDARANDDHKPACYDRNHSKDIIALPYGTWGHTARGLFFGPEAATRTPTLRTDDPYFVTTHWKDEEIAAMPPTFIANGGNELLLDMGTELTARLKSQGVTVTQHIIDYAVHDYWTLHTFLPEAKESYAAFKRWYDSVSGGSPPTGPPPAPPMGSGRPIEHL